MLYRATPLNGKVFKEASLFISRGVTTPNFFVDERVSPGVFMGGNFEPVELHLRTAPNEPIFKQTTATLLPVVSAAPFKVGVEITTKGRINVAFATLLFETAGGSNVSVSFADQAACATQSLALYLEKGFTCTVDGRTFATFTASGNLAIAAADVMVMPGATGFTFDLSRVTFPRTALGTVGYTVMGATSFASIAFTPTSSPGRVRVRESIFPTTGVNKFFSASLVLEAGPDVGPGATLVRGDFAKHQSAFRIGAALLITGGGMIKSFNTAYE